MTTVTDSADLNQWDSGESDTTAPKYVDLPALKLTPVDLAGQGIDELVALYIAERNQLAIDRHAWDDRERQIKAHMEQIGLELLDRGNKLGVDSFRTVAGTAYRDIKTSYSVSMWDDLVAYVKSTGNFQVFQRRVTAEAIREIEREDGTIPPGVMPYTETKFVVRSPVKRSPAARKGVTSAGQE
jgi:hypothetical protein